MTDLDDLGAAFARLASAAGRVVMEVYATDFEVRSKDDASPVSEADERAEALLVPGVQALLPGVRVVAEEAVSRDGLPATDSEFVLIDPVDGTREFVSRNGDFTVNIALVRDGVPVVGAVYAPARQRLFVGGSTAGTAASTSAGSSLKFCLVAAGEADVYPRFGPTMEWDTAAGDAVLRAAGGTVVEPDGTLFRYGKTDTGLRNGPFVAWGGPPLLTT